jgi:hypothetical protein
MSLQDLLGKETDAARLRARAAAQAMEEGHPLNSPLNSPNVAFDAARIR